MGRSWPDGAARASAADIALAALFGAVAQLDVWVLGTVPGPKLQNAAVLALVGPPLAWRRRNPCAALTVSSAAIAAQVLLVAGPPPSGLLYGLREAADRDRRRLAALEQERARMAREVHDILAHSVSLMGLQAAAAEQTLARDPELARPVLRSIQQISRDSVGELRRLVGMLRAEEQGDVVCAPQPRLDRLEALVARMRDAGLPVDLRITGPVQPLPAGVELTAYRVIQEALTNALRHAAPSQVQVALVYGAGRLEISVDNDGAAAAANGGGHGLAGMGERVGLYGGRMSAGGQPGDRFRVTAELPVEPVQR